MSAPAATSSAWSDAPGKLRPVRHGGPLTSGGGKANRFCGPCAVSAITGMPTGETAQIMRRYHGRRSMTGARPAELLFALESLGYHAESGWAQLDAQPGYSMVRYGRGAQAYRQADQHYDRARANHASAPTLATWLRTTQWSREATGACYLVVLTRHFAVVQRDRYVCALTEQLVPVASAPGRRSRVIQVFRVIPS